ncbi:TetR/AcrR family transcriptional regulator [Planobispora longispora]|uniref:TetR family transcriptional regulator n=1 Tax=Planobispora longispora TaxID=28887 RepID=A0A8J3RSD8_9ACTN|nr:TetR/AcrR family transcriptional regulator [Planobispora longispora]BFE88228.1 TetR/AcrR family transcriptional regulator [Planobispora longispora]GIH80932.1 TetR family transcriptional regulator [Planobispora longispora]
MSAAAGAGPRGPGRPRSRESWSAILDVAAELLERDGYLKLSLDTVAARAGVSKRTIYRWWPSKGALAIEAYLAVAADRLTVPDTGSLREDLERYARDFVGLLTETATARTVAGLVAASFDDPELARAFREDFLGGRRAAAGEIFERARERGELRADADIGAALDDFFAPLWYRALFTGAALDGPYAADLADRLTAAYS